MLRLTPLVFLLLVGCGDSTATDGGTSEDSGGASGDVGSCDLRATKASYCQQYDDFGAALAPYRDSCAMNGGTWADAACPAADRVGGCRETTMFGMLTNWFYAGGPYPDADALRTLCETDMSEFVAP